MADAKHTPGPWQWTFDAAYGRPSLGTPDRGRLIVMDFGRKGMQGATPRFALWNGVEEGAPRDRMGGYLMDFTEYHGKFGLHPDARLIAAAPELLEACVAMAAWDAAEKNAKPFDDDNGAGFYQRIAMCAEAFDKARAAIAKATGSAA